MFMLRHVLRASGLGQFRWTSVKLE